MAKQADDSHKALRAIPSVNALADHAALAAHRQRLPRGVVVAAAQQVIDSYRDELRAGRAAAVDDVSAALARRVEAQLDAQALLELRPVINATGIILHTGLGRAPLAAEAAQAVADAAGQYANVELNLADGERGRRTTAVEALLCELTGAEAATVVNNNAAATLLTLVAVAAGKNVVVSRGELIEIGGSFRLPRIMEQSGAMLRETGSTNKTRLSYYEQAINDDTAALMKVHTSNYRVVGFTESVATAELVALGRARGLVVIDDVGSGALVDFTDIGVAGEPTVKGAIDAGADLVLFSGDKLLGGPQAGIILGRRALIDHIESNPLMRALRVDKLTLAALAATLRLYRESDEAWRAVPVLAMARRPVDELRRRAAGLARRLGERFDEARIGIVDDKG